MQYIQDNIWIILLIVNYAVALVTAFFVLLHNRNPSRTLSYFLILIVLPFVGIFVYYFFGQEYRKEKLFDKKKVMSNSILKKWEKRLLVDDTDIEGEKNDIIEKQSKLIKLIQNKPRKPLTYNNKVELLINGNNTFDAIFEALRQAKDHIHLEYYIFSADKIGKQLINILCDKANEGVSVKVMYDYVGNQLKSPNVEQLKSCGVEIHPFMPVWFPNLTRKLNYRDHRKITVIDGVVGFLGGVNISDEYCNGQNDVYWRDTHLKIEGDAVKSLQSQFLLNWSFVTDQEIDIEEKYFPSVNFKANLPIQIVASGPDSRWPYIMEAIFMAINNAQKSIKITTPYFIPNDQILTALKTASRSGVDVQIIIPKEGDSFAAKYATYSYIEELLESGIRVFCYCKGMVHAKTIVIDEQLSSIGTSNMDYRSFNINFEINALLFNDDFGKQMTEMFERDLEDTEELILEQWRDRALSEKLKESFNRLWAPLL
ncbi:cardiolipin synthase [Croceibacter atlanticus]|jgi:cardiolipin synthase|uniref:Cardiolipin synthase n=1 Tax=Croceibacter atlanticus (strain ATCC BAA-628 / JCM 21780 / CIP 108009 / IAM 15332 / KCTC 12090 / HTCC2559) TaxID=216432 RepID=A3UAU3_CROAH|nr:cardiolipin synthase [Croceibacter atlanticus]EAP86929.1 cardiolipin synthetase [Croceibacter atlanticus HTCC2559]MBW4970572.1 cardiolipin synthase [Croceibacter atlanticus]